METYFEIETVITEKMLRESLNKGGCKRLKIYAVMCFVFAALIGLLSVLVQTSEYLAGILGLAGIGVIFLLMPTIYAKHYINGLRKYNDGEVKASITSFGDVIRDETPATTVTVPYEKVKRIHFLDTVIVIEDVKGTSLIFSKDNFIKGDLESFYTFIRQKCPHLNLPQWQW